MWFILDITSCIVCVLAIDPVTSTECTETLILSESVVT